MFLYELNEMKRILKTKYYNEIMVSWEYLSVVNTINDNVIYLTFTKHTDIVKRNTCNLTKHTIHYNDYINILNAFVTQRK